MAINWQIFGYVLAASLIWGILMALLTRYIATHLDGQIYGLVVLGVAGVVAIAGFAIGWLAVAKLALCFAAAGVVMGFEYYSRIIRQGSMVDQAVQQRIDQIGEAHHGDAGAGRTE